jgi:hypothetical protein
LTGRAPRRYLPIVAGLLLLALAASLLASLAFRGNATKNKTDPGADALASCRAFDDVYAATKPGTPIDARALADKLQLSIERMHRAASADGKWRELATSLDEVGVAVNGSDTARAYSAMLAVHDGCAPVLSANRST